MQSLTYDTTRPPVTNKLLVDPADGQLDLRWPVESARSHGFTVLANLAQCLMWAIVAAQRFYALYRGIWPNWSAFDLLPIALAVHSLTSTGFELWRWLRWPAFAQRLTVADDRIRWERMGWLSPRQSDRPASDLRGFEWELFGWPFRSRKDGRWWTIQFATGRDWRLAMHVRDDLVRADLGRAIRAAMAAAGPAWEAP